MESVAHTKNSIKRVHKLAIKENQPRFKNDNLIFKWTTGFIHEDITEDDHTDLDVIEYEFPLNNQTDSGDNFANDSDDGSSYLESDSDNDISLGMYVDTDSDTNEENIEASVQEGNAVAALEESLQQADVAATLENDENISESRPY